MFIYFLYFFFKWINDGCKMFDNVRSCFVNDIQNKATELSAFI